MLVSKNIINSSLKLIRNNVKYNNRFNNYQNIINLQSVTIKEAKHTK